MDNETRLELLGTAVNVEMISKNIKDFLKEEKYEDCVNLLKAVKKGII